MGHFWTSSQSAASVHATRSSASACGDVSVLSSAMGKRSALLRVAAKPHLESGAKKPSGGGVKKPKKKLKQQQQSKPMVVEAPPPATTSSADDMFGLAIPIVAGALRARKDEKKKKKLGLAPPRPTVEHVPAFADTSKEDMFRAVLQAARNHATSGAAAVHPIDAHRERCEAARRNKADKKAAKAKGAGPRDNPRAFATSGGVVASRRKVFRTIEKQDKKFKIHIPNRSKV